MPPRIKPSTCRVHVFYDGQNLFHAAREAFGYTYPNYDPLKLAQAIVGQEREYRLEKIHFYTGVARADKDPFWHGFWTKKLDHLGRQGILVTRRALKYSDQPVEVSPGQFERVQIGREKGIDLRIGLDLVRLARHGAFDVAVIFSQDTDIEEAVTEVKEIGSEFSRWVRLECAFPVGAGSKNSRGLAGTTWRTIDKTMYDACIDPGDYRAKSA